MIIPQGGRVVMPKNTLPGRLLEISLRSIFSICLPDCHGSVYSSDLLEVPTRMPSSVSIKAHVNIISKKTRVPQPSQSAGKLNKRLKELESSHESYKVDSAAGVAIL